jgi:TadE-like protein
MARRRSGRGHPRRWQGYVGQALTEFALVFPIFVLVVFSIILLGLAIFYQTEVTNAARQAARYAAIHSSTAQCPTNSWLPPQAPPLSYYVCDPPTSWPGMKTAARSAVWGLNASNLSVMACWSGYRDPGDPSSYDYPAIDPDTGNPNTFEQCTMAGTNPIDDESALTCPASNTTIADDKASDKPGGYVTVYTCYQWAPPMAGFVFIPSVVTIRAVVTEVIQQQQ